LSSRERALVDFATLLTLHPEKASAEHLDALRDHGLTDEDLFLLVHVIGYFNHINRVADGLGVDLEPDMPKKAPPGV
jgi:alkylhydroperoxidase family enzyme